MTFLIRHVSFTAGHREIVRTTAADRPSLTVGRAAENDISLPDLAVEPRTHARIERRDDRRITVAATSCARGFEVDGRTMHRCAEIDAAKGAELPGSGGHRITVMRDGDAQAMSRTEGRAGRCMLSDTAGERDEAPAYSMKGLLPGRRSTAWLLVAAVLLGFLALPIWSFLQHSTVPIIAASTVSTPIIAGRAWPVKRRTSCIGGQLRGVPRSEAFVSVRDDACVACHKDVHGHAPPARLAGARDQPGFGGWILASIAHAFNKARCRRLCRLPP